MRPGTAQHGENASAEIQVSLVRRGAPIALEGVLESEHEVESAVEICHLPGEKVPH